MATAYGFELLGDMSSTGDKSTAKVEKTAARTASTGTSTTEQGTAGKPVIFYTNGNWATGKGCYHTDSRCWALTKATTGVTAGNLTAAKNKGMTECKFCKVQCEKEKPLLEELSNSLDSTEDCSNNYMFSITADCGIHTAILACCDNTVQACGAGQPA